MFGRNLSNWDESFTWAKWITPSRDLIRLYEEQGDTKRYNESVVWYDCGWSNYYPADHYAFMYKCRSAFNSIIYLRYADILLLKAEAKIMGEAPDLNGAATSSTASATAPDWANFHKAPAAVKKHCSKLIWTNAAWTCL